MTSTSERNRAVIPGMPPIPARPQELPDLRLQLIDLWRGPLAELSDTANAGVRQPGPQFAQLDVGFDLMYLRRAGLWWVGADMGALVAHAATTLPPTTLTRELLPAPEGFVVLASPLVGTDSDTGADIAVHAMLWGEARLRRTGRRYLGVSLYADMDGTLLPVGRTDWEFGVDTEAPTTDELIGDQQRIDSMAEDRRWFATLCLLAANPVAANTPMAAPRPVARRSARAGVASTVRLVDVARRPHQSHGDDGGDVPWSHRWMVSGHWRQQAFGPNRSQRRPVWIAPHVKGPADLPLVLKDEVHVLRGPQPN